MVSHLIHALLTTAAVGICYTQIAQRVVGRQISPKEIAVLSGIVFSASFVVDAVVD